MPQNIEKAVAGGLGGAGVQVVLADVLDSRTLRAAMQGVDAVIITTGYSGSLLNPGGFKKIDQEVRTHMSSHLYTCLYCESICSFLVLLAHHHRASSSVYKYELPRYHIEEVSDIYPFVDYLMGILLCWCRARSMP